jgi:hypothetical protein
VTLGRDRQCNGQHKRYHGAQQRGAHGMSGSACVGEPGRAGFSNMIRFSNMIGFQKFAGAFSEFSSFQKKRRFEENLQETTVKVLVNFTNAQVYRAPTGKLTIVNVDDTDN